MKKMMFTMVLMVTIVTSASAMTFNEAREHAMFLTDKMSYELGLSPTQLNNVYEINLDFVMAAAIRGERLSTCLSRRDTDLNTFFPIINTVFTKNELFQSSDESFPASMDFQYL